MPDLTRVFRVWRRLRRAVLRRRRLVLALLVAGLVVTSLRVMAPPPPPVVEVVVAARDLVSGTVIGENDVRVQDFPPGAVPEGSSDTPALVVGRSVAAPMRAGEPLTDRRLVGAGLLEGYRDGLVATPVRIADPDVVRLLRVGDRIDLFAATPQGGATARRVLTGAAVVTIPPPTDAPANGALVVVASTEAEAAVVAQAATTGTLSLSLRR